MIFVALCTLLFLAHIGHYFWHRQVVRDIVQGAPIAFDRLQHGYATLMEGISRSQFEQIYRTVMTPRQPTYLLAAFTIFIISLPVIFAVLAGGAWMMTAFTELTPSTIPEESFTANESGAFVLSRRLRPDVLILILQDWSGFYYFFGLLSAWIAIFGLVLYRYYRCRPESLLEEIQLTRETHVQRPAPIRLFGHNL